MGVPVLPTGLQGSGSEWQPQWVLNMPKSEITGESDTQHRSSAIGICDLLRPTRGGGTEDWVRDKSSSSSSRLSKCCNLNMGINGSVKYLRGAESDIKITSS